MSGVVLLTDPVRRVVGESFGPRPTAMMERRRAAEALREEFLAAAPADRHDLRFHSPDLLELMLEESEAAQLADPASAELLAGWAERLAEALRDKRRLASDAQVRALRLQANARRLLRDLEGAEDALGCALDYLAAESRERPYVHVAWGLLRWDQVRPEEAIAHFHQAARLFFDAGALQDEGTCRLLAGLVSAEIDDPERARMALLRGRELAVPARHPWLNVCAGLTLARLVAEIGHCGPGRKIFDEVRELPSRVPAEGASLEAQRLEGAARARLGEIGAARELLEAVRHRQLERGDLPGLLLASLDLAVALDAHSKGEMEVGVRRLILGVQPFPDEEGRPFAVEALEAFRDDVRHGIGAGRAAGRAAAEFRRQCGMFEVRLRDPFPFA